MMTMNWLSKEKRIVVGLMSGTSADGLDIAFIEINGSPLDGQIKLLAYDSIPYQEEMREQILQLCNPAYATIDRVGSMNFKLGKFYAEAVLQKAKEFDFQMKDIDCIGSHGQTIFHHAVKEDNYTVQIGEGAVISNLTGVPCVSDFRVADMAVGGQGAPLVPFSEYILYRQQNKTRLLQNLGGIGNITILPKDGKSTDVFAFDTGPGNMIIDELVARYTDHKEKMDIGGKYAAAGKVNGDLLQWMQAEEYYKLPLPKSTGRELFGKQYVDNIVKFIEQSGISMLDAISTATELTAWSMEDAYLRYIKPKYRADQLIIGGGGSYNQELVKRIRNRMQIHQIETLIQEDLGLSSDAKEAVAFALMADCTMAGISNNVPSVTGAAKPVVLGKISY